MTVQVADAHEHVQKLVSVVKMVTTLEECTTRHLHSVVHFLWAKGSGAKDIVTRGPFLGKKMGKHVAIDRLTLGHHLVTEHGFHGYKN
jgi:hypothetical protein